MRRVIPVLGTTFVTSFLSARAPAQEPRLVLNGHRSGVFSLAFGPDGRVLLPGSAAASVGPNGAVAGWAGAAVGAGGAVGGGTRVAATGSGTYYRSAAAVTGRGAYIRQGFTNYNCFRPGWYARYAGAWVAAGLTAAAVWSTCSWGTVASTCG
jgi:hypothetical protein